MEQETDLDMTKEECIGLLDRYAHYNGMGIVNLVRCKEAMLKAIELLKEPSLPSNLDEAVKEAMPESYGFLEMDIYGGSEPVYSREQMRDIFLAGAEWMAQQGDSFESTVLVDAMGDSYVDGYYLTEKIPEGDKVIVQIRKK